MKQSSLEPPSAAAEHCLVRSVAQVFETEPALEAVKFNRAEHSLSLATLGKPDTAGIEKAVSERIKQAEGQAHCGLLRGDPDCARCLTPVPASALPRLTVEHGSDTTTISRVTCPTAPKFWRWKAVPFPKIVPREVLLPDEEDHEHVWKWQLALAVLCGVFGLLAQFALGGHAATVAYTLAYVAGGWFTLHEVWERLKHGHLDVHFLMLAVAAGSASVGAWAEGATLLFLFSLSGVGRAGTLRDGPDEPRDSLPVQGGPEDRHDSRRNWPRADLACFPTPRRHAAALEAGRAVPGRC